VTASRYDGRISAWICSWQALQAAERIATKSRQRPDRWALHYLHTQARIYAILAQASTEVGYGAGNWLAQQESERIREAERNAERMADIMTATEKKGGRS
jgi:hypothetical protein